MPKSVTIRDTTITLSDDAAALLKALVELQEAGLVENGRTELLVRDGYDEGSLEAESAPTVTQLGQQVAACL